MKKTLFELTIEEFTRVLLDFPEEICLSIKTYDEKGCLKKSDEDGCDIVGTYKSLYEYSKNYHSSHPISQDIQKALSDSFDYDISIDRLDIYNYLEHVTNSFQEDKVKIILNEMDCFYLMVYLEEIDSEVQKKFIENGWEFPTKKIFGPNLQKKGQKELQIVEDYEEMRNRIYLGRDFFYHTAISLLKRKTQLQQPLKSSYKIANRCKTDFVKIVSAMYDCHLFETTEGKIASNKEDLLNTLGQFFSVDLSASSTLLNEAKKKNNYLDIFDKIKEKGEQYYKKGL